MWRQVLFEFAIYCQSLDGRKLNTLFVSISLVGLLGMLVGILNFDLTVAFPMGHSIVENIMFRGYLMMTSYMEMLVDLVLLDHQNFDVILEMD